MLECYNKEFAKIFGKAHPNMLHFADSFIKEGLEWRKRMNGAHDSVFDLRQDRDPVKWPKIPSEFKDYVKKEEAKKRGKR